SAEDIERSLQPFGRGRSSFVRDSEGTGLGLPLVRSLVEAHDGVFQLTSEPGCGTTATLTFPGFRTIRESAGSATA
ncbi:MAG: sensor histidine kinase, partial [Alphaproteobacteria bacterium]|nr:sensor histidine kinase [Alphaproteobacteria bacterium]